MNRRLLIQLLGAGLVAALSAEPAAAKRGRSGSRDRDRSKARRDRSKGRRGRNRTHRRHYEGHDGQPGHYDYERATQAREKGDVLPLRDILATVRKRFEGEIVGVEFEDKGEAKMYEIKLVTPAEEYLEIYVDARTAEIVKVEGDD